MNIKDYRQIRAAVAVFVAVTIAISASQHWYLLAAIAVITGFLFMTLSGSKAKVRIDEREKTIREKAAQITYMIFAPTIGLGSFILLIPYQKISPVFAKGDFTYLESLGMILAYLTLFLISIYAISYYFLNRKFGGGTHEE